MRKYKLFQIVFFISLASALFFLFAHSFASYFFQDDWFSFKISNAKSIFDVIAFFKPDKNLIYYRPLGMQVIFFINQTIFGITPVPFRILTLGFHLLNGFLVYQLIQFLLNKKILSYTSAFLYVTSSIHLTIFYWAATIAFVIAPTCYFGSFLLYAKGKKIIPSLILFALGLLVNELLVTLPILILLWELFLGRKKLGKTVFFWVLIFLYGIGRFLAGNSARQGAYATTLLIKQLLFNFRDYVLLLFQWPEEVHNQFVHFFILNSVFFHEFLPFIIIWALLFFGCILFFGFLFVDGFVQKKLFKNIRLLLFGGVWFLITLCPVFFFSNHLYSYYLPVPFIGILICWSVLLKQITNKYMQATSISTIMVVWFFASYANVRFNKEIHWAPRRAIFSQKILEQLKKENPDPLNNTVFHVPLTDEYFWALGNQHAVQIFFNNFTLMTIYDK